METPLQPVETEVSELERTISYNYEQLESVRGREPKQPELEAVFEHRMNQALDLYTDAVTFSGAVAVGHES